MVSHRRGLRVAVIVDLHCHILPEIDDGPRSLDASIVQAAAHVRAGVDVVVATPHVRDDLPDNDSARIGSVTRMLSDFLTARDAVLRVAAGAEVDLAYACQLEDEELRALTLGGGPWLLVEAPLSAAGDDAAVLLGMLRARGHQLVLAHPERSPQFLRQPELLRKLVADGAVTQVTARALTGAFGSTVRRYSRWMVEEQLAHVVASDAHDTQRRPPGLFEPLQKAGFGELAPWLIEEGPAAILAGDTVPVPPRVTRGGSLLRRLLGS
jgi:protein-tyrosine phosphatase